jgi:hypothetical protein
MAYEVVASTFRCSWVISCGLRVTSCGPDEMSGSSLRFELRVVQSQRDGISVENEIQADSKSHRDEI